MVAQRPVVFDICAAQSLRGPPQLPCIRAAVLVGVRIEAVDAQRVHPLLSPHSLRAAQSSRILHRRVEERKPVRERRELIIRSERHAPVDSVLVVRQMVFIAGLVLEVRCKRPVADQTVHHLSGSGLSSSSRLDRSTGPTREVARYLLVGPELAFDSVPDVVQLMSLVCNALSDLGPGNGRHDLVRWASVFDSVFAVHCGVRTERAR
eukprot:422012-Rhodomonas_salina.1